jgi:hypothetical protein
MTLTLTADAVVAALLLLLLLFLAKLEKLHACAPT